MDVFFNCDSDNKNLPSSLYKMFGIDQHHSTASLPLMRPQSMQFLYSKNSVTAFQNSYVFVLQIVFKYGKVEIGKCFFAGET